MEVLRYIVFSILSLAVLVIFQFSLNVGLGLDARLAFFISYGIVLVGSRSITGRFIFGQSSVKPNTKNYILWQLTSFLAGNFVFLAFYRLSIDSLFSTISTAVVLFPIRYFVVRSVFSSNRNLDSAGWVSYFKSELLDILGNFGSWVWRNNRERLMRFVGRANNDFRIWLVSLTGIRNINVLVALDVPWWPLKASRYVHSYLQSLVSPKVMEWGSGSSTVWLGKRASVVYSIEHDSGWAKLLQAYSRENWLLEVHAPTSGGEGMWSKKGGFSELSFHDYVVAPETKPGNWDLIIVDGRARERCLLVAEHLIRPGGIILLDNASRKRYKGVIRELLTRGFVGVELFGLTPASFFPTKSIAFAAPISR